MSKHYTIYKRATGEIVEAAQYDSTRNPKEYATVELGVLLLQSSPSTEWVRKGEILPRPKLCDNVVTIVADGIQEVKFEVPAGTFLHYDGVIDTINDGWFQFRTALPRSYKMLLRPPFPAQTQEIEIVANAL